MCSGINISQKCSSVHISAEKASAYIFRWKGDTIFSAEKASVAYLRRLACTGAQCCANRSARKSGCGRQAHVHANLRARVFLTLYLWCMCQRFAGMWACTHVCVNVFHVCVCVCVRERENERARAWVHTFTVQLQCVAVCCSVLPLQCVAVCCRALQCVAVGCSALQCVSVRCSQIVLCVLFFSQNNKGVQLHTRALTKIWTQQVCTCA